MPVVEVKLWAGRTGETKKRVVKAITDAFVKEGVPADMVHVIFIDVDKENWAIGGKMCNE